MKKLKYFILTVAIISGLSSCLVERPGGYYHHPHYHHGGYGRY